MAGTPPSAAHMLAMLPLLAALQPAASQAPMPEEGQVRLASRVDVNGFATGALQVFLDGAYGAVCSQAFDSADADVACLQLGFVGGTVLRSLADDSGSQDFLSRSFRESVLQEVAAPFVLGDLGCTGTEERLIDCAANRVVEPATETNPGYYYYSDYGSLDGQCEPVFVACGMSTDIDAAEGDVRLAGMEETADGNSASGILEVFSSGAWGRVCRLRANSFRARNSDTPSIFSQQSARVVCRQLGFTSGTVAANQDVSDYETAFIDDDTWRVPVVLAGARCTGSEAALTDCPGVALEADSIPCGLSDEVSIVCVNDADEGTNGAVRLADGGAGLDFQYGRLEVFSNGTWGSVCDRRAFSTASAQVACKSLGFDGGAPLRFYQPYENIGKENEVLIGSLPVKMAEVKCAGDESSLLECPARTTNIQRCGFLTPGKTDATVVACANSNGAAGCPSPAEEESSIRLRGGVGTPCDALHSGFVEVFHDGVWGIAAISIATLAADVACRQLGFPHGTAVPRDSVTPFAADDPDRPSEVSWLRNIRCRGPEARLVDCDLRRGFDRQEIQDLAPPFVVCRQFAVEAAQENITTPLAGEGDLRLADETTAGPWVSGRLEIFFEGSWSQVCGLGFDGFDAAVACRQLGYGAGTANTVRRVAGSEESLRGLEFQGADGAFPEVALTKVGCKGNEASILECGGDGLIDGLRTRECFQDTDPGLFLSCVADPVEGEEGALRLVNGTAGDGFATGVLEVFHAGAWGTVCDGRRMPVARPFDRDDIVEREAYIGISNAAADVVCQQLGFDVGAFQQVNGRDRTNPPWVGQLECTGFEEVFTECDDVLFGDTQECIDSQLRLACASANAADRLGEARLAGGRADSAEPQAWRYGLMEVHDGFIFGESCLDGQAAAVACRSLGFTTGAQIFVPGDNEALAEQVSEVSRITGIECTGAEADLSGCEIEGSVNQFVEKFQVLREGREPRSCAVACSRPAGCRAAGPRPPAAQGDVRLVPILTRARATSTCDAMHFGAVELFNNGRWGRICAGSSGSNLAAFQLDAAVACRQLGFPFATLLPLGRGNVDQVSAAVVWATDVRCTGVEQRLDECFFPEAAGNGTAAGLPGEPIAGASCLEDQADRFAVMCRMFEIEGSQFVR